GKRYRIWHNLGVIPSSIELYLSFDQYGTKDAGGTLAPAAGDQAQGVSLAEKTLIVVNGTRAGVWLLLVAREKNAPATAYVRLAWRMRLGRRGGPSDSELHVTPTSQQPCRGSGISRFPHAV